MPVNDSSKEIIVARKREAGNAAATTAKAKKLLNGRGLSVSIPQAHAVRFHPDESENIVAFGASNAVQKEVPMADYRAMVEAWTAWSGGAS